MDRNVIYFDFDRTLLDTDALKAEQAKRIANNTGLTIEQVNEGMRRYVNSVSGHLQFSPDGFSIFLSQYFTLDPHLALNVYMSDPRYIATYLFPEVLEELTKRGYRLGIFSAAMFGYQKVKIENSGVLNWIPWSSVLISPKKLEKEILSQIPDGATVVDDDISVVNTLMVRAPSLIPVWCNRKTEETHATCKTIKSLRDLL